MQLVIGELQTRLQALAQGQRPSCARHEHAEPLGAGPLPDQPPKAVLDQPRLARAGGAADDQARAAVHDGIALAIAEPVEETGTAMRAGEQVELPAVAASCVLGAHRLTA